MCLGLRGELTGSRDALRRWTAATRPRADGAAQWFPRSRRAETPGFGLFFQVGRFNTMDRSSLRCRAKSHRFGPTMPGVSIVKVNAITVPRERFDEFERRFAARAGRVSSAPGFASSRFAREWC